MTQLLISEESCRRLVREDIFPGLPDWLGVLTLSHVGSTCSEHCQPICHTMFYSEQVPSILMPGFIPTGYDEMIKSGV